PACWVSDSKCSNIYDSLRLAKCARSGSVTVWLAEVIRRSVLIAKALIQGEIRCRDLDLQEILAAGEVQRSGRGRLPGSHVKNIADVLAAIRGEGDAVLDRPVDRVHAVDFAQGDDFAQVMARVHAALLESLVLDLTVTPQAQELHQQALLTSVAPLREERLRMIWVLDILASIVTANMA